MSLKLDYRLSPRSLLPAVERLFEHSARKIDALQRRWDPARGTPVFTARGRYTTRGWTEWTQGFQFGSMLLQYDATEDGKFLEAGRRATVEHMAPHVSHTGVHDHGFNNISTYGQLWRLMHEGRLPLDTRERDFYELALKVSGAVQAARWTELDTSGGGYIYSFNGPHSLFIDTLRSLRSLAMAHRLGHVLMGERDRRISLLQRLLAHALTTAEYNIFYGDGRDHYDLPGRTAHESIFNLNDRSYRCPNSQQGYSPFTTWTRGLAWAILGFAEQLEFLAKAKRLELDEAASPPGSPCLTGAGSAAVAKLLRAAMVTAEFYLKHACTDGIPYWDTGAPQLHRIKDATEKPADPFNSWEPVDSSAAAIAAQGLFRLGRYLRGRGFTQEAKRFTAAGLTIARTLFSEPYLSTSAKHEGLLLHSVYHRPNNWDCVRPGQRIPNRESSMWGDYHLRELALLLLREAKARPYLTFFSCTA